MLSAFRRKAKHDHGQHSTFIVTENHAPFNSPSRISLDSFRTSGSSSPNYSSSDSSSCSNSSSSVDGDDEFFRVGKSHFGFHANDNIQTFIPMRNYQHWTKGGVGSNDVAMDSLEASFRSSADESSVVSWNLSDQRTHSVHADGGWLSETNSLTYSQSDATMTKDSSLSTESTSVGLNPYNVFTDDQAWVNAWKIRSREGRMRRSSSSRTSSRRTLPLESVEEKKCIEDFDDYDSIEEVDADPPRHISPIDTTKPSPCTQSKVSINTRNHSCHTLSTESENKKFGSSHHVIGSYDFRRMEHNHADVNSSNKSQEFGTSLSRVPIQSNVNSNFPLSENTTREKIQTQCDEEIDRWSQCASDFEPEVVGCMVDTDSYKIHGRKFLTRLREQTKLYQQKDDQSIFSSFQEGKRQLHERSTKIDAKIDANRLSTPRRSGWVDKVWSPKNDWEFTTFTYTDEISDTQSRVKESSGSGGNYEDISVMRSEIADGRDMKDRESLLRFKDYDSIFDLSDDDSLLSFLTKDSASKSQKRSVGVESPMKPKGWIPSNTFDVTASRVHREDQREIEENNGLNGKSQSTIVDDESSIFSKESKSRDDTKLYHTEEQVVNTSLITNIDQNLTKHMEKTKEDGEYEEFFSQNLVDCMSKHEDIEASLSLLTKVRRGKIGRFLKRFRRKQTDKGIGSKRRKRPMLFFRKREERETPMDLFEDPEITIPDPLTLYKPLEEDNETSVQNPFTSDQKTKDQRDSQDDGDAIVEDAVKPFPYTSSTNMPKIDIVPQILFPECLEDQLGDHVSVPFDEI